MGFIFLTSPYFVEDPLPTGTFGVTKDECFRLLSGCLSLCMFRQVQTNKAHMSYVRRSQIGVGRNLIKNDVLLLAQSFSDVMRFEGGYKQRRLFKFCLPGLQGLTR